MSLIEFIKNIAPIVVALIAIFYTNRNVLRQTRLSAKVQWIDTFKINIVKLVTKQYLLDRSFNRKTETYGQDEYTNFLEQILLIRILLNKNDSNHKILIDELDKLSLLIKSSNIISISIINQLRVVTEQSESIIDFEQQKI